MALDDPIVWILIIAVVVFLFGSSKIPQFARALGQARKEFDQGWKGVTSPASQTPVADAGQTQPPMTPPQVNSLGAADPLVLAAQNEGIDTRGKTRDQIATELAWKLKEKQ